MAQVVVQETGNIQAVLEKLPIEMRRRALPKAVRKGGLVVKREMKRRAPRGNPKHKPQNKPLWKTIALKAKDYRNKEINMVIVGAEYPAGAHSHLVDQGHEMVVSRGSRKGQAPLGGGARVEGKKYVAASIDSTKDAVEQAVIDSIVADIKKAGG